MAYIDWTEEFSVNVREIDAHHKKLLDYINILHQSLLDNKGAEAQKITVNGMVDYTDFHFTAEEKLMLRHNYPQYQKHKLEHGKFTEMALDLQQRTNDAGFVLTLEILNFLKNWLQDHILIRDKEFSRHFNLNGVY
ncbi:MAG: bacteriohemerythrin [Geobacteraceae bacterium]